MVTIAVDAMTTEKGPEMAILGGLRAARKNKHCNIVLVGDKSIIESALSWCHVPKNVSIVHASEVIEMKDKSSSWRHKKDSSLRKCIDIIKSGDADCFVSAGNSGASNYLASLHFGLIDGLRSPRIKCRMPTKYDGKYVHVCDVGVLTDYDSKEFAQNAVLTAHYLKIVEGIEKPKLALVAVGEEEGKGGSLITLVSDCMKAMHQSGLIEFIGNVEASHIVENFKKGERTFKCGDGTTKESFESELDAVICGGDIGNVLIKAPAKYVRQFVDDLKHPPLYAALLLLPAVPYLLYFKFLGKGRKYEPSLYSGAPILGTLEGKGVITHGSADVLGMQKACEVGIDYALSADIADPVTETLHQFDLYLERRKQKR
ncbi:hypothetical protein KY328_03780 [Candidatus Woesearchaeota archaeon]|nr:hypothetical protein [Candidatus Woesearchaeota archaeon]MBW3022016.1 hypothetical protein [Candidatus Woesearchaeota archaeon]